MPFVKLDCVLNEDTGCFDRTSLINLDHVMTVNSWDHGTVEEPFPVTTLTTNVPRPEGWGEVLDEYCFVRFEVAKTLEEVLDKINETLKG